MGMVTYPPNPFPPSSEKMGDAVEIERDIASIKDDITSIENEVNDLNGNKANQITIAPFFNAETSYSAGDIVYYNGLTYRCVNDHDGEWDADDFAPTTISNELDSLKSGLTGKQDIYGNATKLSEIAADATSATVTATKNGYLSLVYEMTTTNRNISGKIRDGNVVQLGATFNITALAYAGEPICTIPCVNGHIYSVEVSAGHEGISIYQM